MARSPLFSAQAPREGGQREVWVEASKGRVAQVLTLCSDRIEAMRAGFTAPLECHAAARPSLLAQLDPVFERRLRLPMER